ncbi:SDR family oxidoreductase [Alloalcanivorax mobilis]|uniref:SDR family oxidoreductase n=1 Tax=Alloalcanivorax mobilis TaxID=2019569 RepID=UPI000B5B2553|nr:SDR family oxidoreductase [Alloalcanivorax mobilis]ASK36178.1 short chain dehydrogenase [Alcanivorax sp. N3-2A]
MTTLRDQPCLITGAASGIGRAVALAAGEQGAKLVLTDVDASGLADTLAALHERGARVLASRALDITDHAAVRAFADTVHAEHGAMAVLMNVAGIAIWGPVEQLRLEHWRALVEVNLMGPVHVIECFLPTMVAAGRGGHLVTVSSAAGLFGLPWHAAYNASKFALRGMSEAMRYDLKRHRIRVSLVCPGAVDTGLVRTLRIVGIDQNTPRVARLKQRFQRHAVSPAEAARRILKGLEKNRYLIYTSPEIRLGYWFKRKFAWPLERVIALIGRQLEAVAREQNR